MELRSSADVMSALENGCRVSLVWRDDGPFNKLPDEVIACMGNSILVRGWSDSWVPLGGDAYRLYAHAAEPPPTFPQWLSANNIELPNLGVNCPVGCDTAAAAQVGMLYQEYLSSNGNLSGRNDGSRISADRGTNRRRFQDGGSW